MRAKSIGVVTAVGFLMTGCALVYGPAALEAGPDAEEAVQHLEGNWLVNVAREGKNPKARVYAVKKLTPNEVEYLGGLVNDKDKQVRAAAAERLEELGVLDDELKRGCVAKQIAEGEEFPEAMRVKAIKQGDVSRELLSSLIMNKGEKLAVRKAAIQRIDYLEVKPLAALLDDAADKSNPNHAACMEMVKSWLLSSDLGTNGSRGQRRSGGAEDVQRKMDKLINVVWSHPSADQSCKASKRARVLAFQLIDGDKNKAEAIKHAVWRAKDDGEGGENSENIEFANELIMATTSEVVLEEFVANPGALKEDILVYIKAALTKINDENFIVKNVLAQGGLFKDDSAFLLKTVEKIKNPATREKWCDKIIARYSKDANERRSAFERIFARNVNQAFGMARGFSADELEMMTNQKILIGLLKIHGEATKNDWDRIKKATRKSLETALLKKVAAQEKLLTQEQRKRLVAAQISKAQELNKAGKTLVVGNCYLGMPLLGLLALNNVQEFKVQLSDLGLNNEDKVVVKSFLLSSKDLYKATGLEKADVKFKFPSQFGVSPFHAGITKIKYEQNQIAEYFGDYSSSFSGGDLYFESETQAKEVKVLLWEKSGVLIISKLNE